MDTLFNKKYYHLFFIIILIIYCVGVTPLISQDINDLFNNYLVKTAFIILILFSASFDQSFGLLMVIAFLLSISYNKNNNTQNTDIINTNIQKRNIQNTVIQNPKHTTLPKLQQTRLNTIKNNLISTKNELKSFSFTDDQLQQNVPIKENVNPRLTNPHILKCENEQYQKLQFVPRQNPVLQMTQPTPSHNGQSYHTSNLSHHTYKPYNLPKGAPFQTNCTDDFQANGKQGKTDFELTNYVSEIRPANSS